MYEPQMKGDLPSLQNVGYCFRYWNQTVDPLDPELDGIHLHNCMEAYVNLSGEVSFWVQNRVYHVGNGDIILTSSNDLHRCLFPKKENYEYFCVWVSEKNQNVLLNWLPKNVYLLSGGNCDKLREIKNGFQKAEQSEDKISRALALLEFLSLLREYAQSVRKEKTLRVPEEFQQILDDMNDRFGEITHVGQLAEKFFISPASLNRWFSQYLHVTPKTYLESVKLAQAKKALANGKSVTDVCYLCGYEDCSHFIRVFKKRTGRTPHQYKKEVLQPDRESDHSEMEM